MRCLLAAGLVAIVELLIQSLGIGLTFTILAILVGGCIPLLLIERSRGINLRQSRARNMQLQNVGTMENDAEDNSQ